jgi:hypothetical protein
MTQSSFNYDQAELRLRTELLVNYQANRLQNSIGSYLSQMEQATLYTINNTQTVNPSTLHRDLYSADGFVSRPTHYDLFSLFNSKETQDLTLRTSLYQVQENSVFSALSQRPGSVELVTQSYLKSPLPDISNEAELIKNQNKTAMNVLLGNDIATKVLTEQGKTVATVGFNNFSLHAKVGYLYNTPDTASIAFISTQNITDTLSRAHTTEEMLILRSHNFSDSKRTFIRNNLIQEIKDITDSIYTVASDPKYNLASLEVSEVINSLSLVNPKEFVEDIKRSFQSKRSGVGPNRTVFIRDEIQTELLNKLRKLSKDGEKSKVVISMQYVESLFIQSKSGFGGKKDGPKDAAYSEYNKNIRKEMLKVFRRLAEQDRLSIGVAGKSYGDSQGLFPLLDRYYNEDLARTKADGDDLYHLAKNTMKVLLEHKSFSILPTRFAHSKSFAVIDDSNAQDLKLLQYGIGSSNLSYKAYKDNLEVFMMLDKNTVGGLTDKEQQEIADYYYYGVSNFSKLNRGANLSSPTQRRGSQQQTDELISILKKMGGVYSTEGTPKGKEFSYTIIYDPNTYKRIGVDISIGSLNGELPGYSFSVTLGEERGISGQVEPVAYLSKTGRVINGMTFVNNSSRALKVLGDKTINPRGQQTFNALEVVGGLVNTMRHMLTFEATRGSINQALNIMTAADKTTALQKILGTILSLEMNKHFPSLTSREKNFSALLMQLQSQSINNNLKQKILTDTLNRLKTYDKVYAVPGMNPSHLKARGDLISNLYKDKTAADFFKKPLDARNQGDAIVAELLDIIENTRSNKETATMFSDIQRLMVKSDRRAQVFYDNRIRRIKTEMFNQITSPFMQPHELRYSMGQAMFKRPVYGINDDIYDLAEEQGTLDLLLSPHPLRHGETLEVDGKGFIRGKADHKRFIKPELYDNLGGIYNVAEGAVTIRQTHLMMQTMRGLSVINKKEYKNQVRKSLKNQGYTKEEITRIVDAMTNELFSINKNVSGDIDNETVMYFPYRVTEQIPERMRNLQSTRPVESASYKFGLAADTLGADSAIGDVLSNPETLIDNTFLTSLAPHQFRIIQDRLNTGEDAVTILQKLKVDYANSQLLVRGFLGGKAPKRVLQSIGISTMSDFSYVNEGFRYEAGNNKTRPEYVQYHVTNISLDSANLLGNTSFKADIEKHLKQGTSFIHKDQLIVNENVKTALKQETVNVANLLISNISADDIASRLGLESSKLSNTLRNLIAKFGEYGDATTITRFEDVRNLDRRQLNVINKLLGLTYESVNFRGDTNSFYYKGGVYSPVSSSSNNILDRLKSVRRIGDIDINAGYFTINAFSQYTKQDGQRRRQEYIKFKLPATSAREYRGVSFLVENPYIYHSGASSIQLELTTATRRDMVSNLRPGSDTSKGPAYLLESRIFEQLKKEQEERKLDTLLPQRIRKQDIYAILSPSQIKGFNFEQGLMLIEDKDSSFLKEIKKTDGSKALAEGLALMMLGEKAGSDTIMQLLATSLNQQDSKTQAAKALDILAKHDYAKKMKLPKRKLGDTATKTDNLEPTFTVFGELSSLALPAYVKQELAKDTPDISQALIKTVADALRGDTAALSHIKTQSIKLFETARSNPNSFNYNNRFIFNDESTRTASVLAFFTKASQDLFRNINIKNRLTGKSISEINAGYFLQGDNIEHYYSNNNLESKNKAAVLALIQSVQVIGSVLNIHLPTPEEIQKLEEDKRKTKIRELQLGLQQLDTILRLNRFLEFGVEQMPSRIAVAIGMQNMTKMEGQYMYELTKNQMGLYTDRHKESEDILNIQQAVLMLGSIVEGELIDPTKAKTKYKIQANNLALIGHTGSPLEFISKFTTAYTEQADKGLPTIVNTDNKTTSLAKEAILNYVLGDNEKSNVALSELSNTKNILLGLLSNRASEAQEDSTSLRLSKIEDIMLDTLLSDNAQKNKIRDTLQLITLFRTRLPSTDTNTLVRFALQYQKLKGTVSVPEEYYVSLFTSLYDSGATAADIDTFLTKERLEDAGVFTVYREQLRSRIESAKGTSIGTEYVNQSLESLRSYSKLLKNISSTSSLNTEQRERAESLYKSVTSTQLVTLPALYIGLSTTESGKYDVFYSPDSKQTGTHGILLGLDLLEKLSLVFQGQSHDALVAQIRLRYALEETAPLLKRIADHQLLNPASLDNLPTISAEEKKQYENLQTLLLQTQATTMDLINNQETIRQAGSDRLKLVGFSSIAMSSFLLSSHEIAAGSKFEEISQDTNTPEILTKNISDVSFKLNKKFKEAKGSVERRLRGKNYDLDALNTLIDSNDALKSFVYGSSAYSDNNYVIIDKDDRNNVRLKRITTTGEERTETILLEAKKQPGSSIANNSIRYYTGDDTKTAQQYREELSSIEQQITDNTERLNTGIANRDQRNLEIQTRQDNVNVYSNSLTVIRNLRNTRSQPSILNPRLRQERREQQLADILSYAASQSPIISQLHTNAELVRQRELLEIARRNYAQLTAEQQTNSFIETPSGRFPSRLPNAAQSYIYLIEEIQGNIRQLESRTRELPSYNVIISNIEQITNLDSTLQQELLTQRGLLEIARRNYAQLSAEQQTNSFIETPSGRVPSRLPNAAQSQIYLIEEIEGNIRRLESQLNLNTNTDILALYIGNIEDKLQKSANIRSLITRSQNTISTLERDMSTRHRRQTTDLNNQIRQDRKSLLRSIEQENTILRASLIQEGTYNDQQIRQRLLDNRQARINDFTLTADTRRSNLLLAQQQEEQSYRERINRRQAVINRYEQQIAQLNQTITRLESAMERRIEALNIQLDSERSEIADETERINDIRSQLSTLRSSKRDLKSLYRKEVRYSNYKEYKRLSKEIRDKEREIARLEEGRDAERARLEQQKAELKVQREGYKETTYTKYKKYSELTNEEKAVARMLTSSIDTTIDRGVINSETLFRREVGEEILNKGVEEYNLIKREYYLRGGETAAMPVDLEITKSHIDQIARYTNNKYLSVDQINDFILKLVLATDAEGMNAARVAETQEEAKRSYEQNKNKIKGSITFATTLRAGSPSGTSLLSETGTLLNETRTVEELRERADILNTNISPAEEGSNTLVLMSALGTHYTQLGDNDGDSFQSAVTQMAVLTRRIKEQSQKIKELQDRISLKHQPRIENNDTAKELAQEVRRQDIQEEEHKLENLTRQHNEALKQFELIRNNAVSRAKKGIRTFARVYSALPEELIGDSKFIKDIHLQTFVKQFRDTIGAADHVGSVMTATQQLSPKFLSSLRFLTEGTTEAQQQARLNSIHSNDIRRRLLSGFEGVSRDSEEFRTLQQYLTFLGKEESDLTAEEQNLLEDLTRQQRTIIQAKSNKATQEDLMAPLVKYVQTEIATVAQLGAATSTITSKILKSAQGSIINDQTLQELQAIIGTSTGGLLGTTYNTVVPLIALQMANIGALKALSSKEDKSYRLALAAGIMAQTSASSTLSIPSVPIAELNNLKEQLLTGQYSAKAKIAQLQAEKDIEVAMRFVTTTQQFIRDAGLKPKERKGDTSGKSGPKSLLEAVDTYTIDPKIASEYNIDKEKAEKLQGLTSIIRAIEEANDPKNANKFREELLNRFLSTKVGEPLIAAQMYKDDEALSTLRSFAALQIVTDYLSGKYKTADDLINNSPLSTALKSAQSSKEYEGYTSDDFITKYIANLYSDFQLKYTVSNVSVDLANRKEQFNKGYELLEYYGLDREGNILSDRDTKLNKITEDYLKEKSLFREYTSGDKDAEEFREEYYKKLTERSDAVSTAIKALSAGGKSDEGIVYQTAMEALISKNIEQDSESFIKGLQQLKGLHSTIQNMKANNLPGVDQLEQELGLYSTAFANRLGSGHTDLNLFTGFFATIIPKLAELKQTADAKKAAGDSSMYDNLLYSLAGINNADSLFSPNLITPTGVDETEFTNAYKQAGTHKATFDQRLQLAKEHTKLNYAQGDTDLIANLDALTFSSIDESLSESDKLSEFDRQSLQIEELVSRAHELKKQTTTGVDLDKEIAKYTEFKQDLSTIKHLNKSSVDYAAETNAFSYAVQQLTTEMIDIGEKLRSPELSDEDEKRLRERGLELENMLFRPQDNRQALINEFRNLGVDSGAEDLVNKLEQTIATHTKQVQKEQNEQARVVLGKTASRINSMSEGLSILAIPALFAIMQNPGDSVEQIAAGTLDMYQSMVGSPTAMGIMASPLSTPSPEELLKSHRVMQSMQVTRIRNQLKYNDSFTAGLAAGVAFEGIFKASQALTKQAVDYFDNLQDGFSSTVKGRFLAEFAGGIIGLGLAGLMTNSQAGLPTEDYTESNIALRVIDQIRQSSQAATNNYIEAVISSMSDIVYDNNDSYYYAQVDFSEEGVSNTERNQILGTLNLYDENMSELDQQYDNYI